MIPVHPHEPVTLMLNSSYQAISFVTARAALRHLMTGSVKGFDSSGTPISWDGKGEVAAGAKASYYCWMNRNVATYPDQPCLRSSSMDSIIEWPIPTIIMCKSNFGYSSRRNVAVSLRALYKHYKQTCQYCLDKIPFDEATKDHAFPKSKGGSNDDTNLILACRSCNNKKDSHYPYFDVNGVVPKPKPLGFHGVYLPRGIEMREEWRPFIHHVTYLS